MAAIDAALFIENQQLFAQAITRGAGEEMGIAIQVLQSLGGIDVNPDLFPGLTIAPPQPGDPGEVPQYNGPHYEAPTLDATKPTFDPLPPFSLPSEPSGPPGLLAYVEPRLPNARIDGTLLDGIPTLDTDLTLPSAPDLLGEIHGIAAPELISVVIPPAPAYLAPQFEGVRPLFTATAPTDLEARFRAQYDTIAPAMRSAISAEFDSFMARMFPGFAAGLAAIESRLATYLGGGTALSPAIEDAIYSRTQDKVNADGERARDKLFVESARAGFTMITPQVLGQLREADQAGRDNNARAATEIAIKQAELEQSNLQFAVKQSTELRKIAIDAGLSYYGHLVTLNGQAMQYARDVLEMVVKAFDIAARYAEIQARIYEADARVYEARGRGAMAVIEAYTATIKGLEAQVNVNVAQVQAYRTRIEAVTAEGNVYRTLVDALVAGAGLQRLKLELYGERVRAYTAQVNASTAEFQGYEAAVRGQAAKVQASAEGVRAYAVQVQAYGETVRAKATQVESVSRANESKVRAFVAQVEAYRAQVAGEAESIKAEINSYDETIKAYIAKAEAISHHAQAEVAAYEAGLRAVIATANIFMEQLKENDNLRIHRAEGIARVAVAAGEQYAHVAASVMSGLNTLVSDVTSRSG